MLSGAERYQRDYSDYMKLQSIQLLSAMPLSQ